MKTLYTLLFILLFFCCDSLERILIFKNKGFETSLSSKKIILRAALIDTPRGEEVLEFGHVWAIRNVPQLGKDSVSRLRDSQKSQEFQTTISNALVDSVYAFRAYAITAIDTFYTNTEFVKLASPPNLLSVTAISQIQPNVLEVQVRIDVEVLRNLYPQLQDDANCTLNNPLTASTTQYFKFPNSGKINVFFDIPYTILPLQIDLKPFLRIKVDNSTVIVEGIAQTFIL